MHRSLPFAVGSWLACAGLATPLAAQVRDTVQLQDIVVTADRVPVPEAEAAASTTVLTGAELQARGIRFVGDALRQVPGAAVVSTGSYGGSTSLFMRGGESDYVKVLVDGVPVNDPGGFYDFANLSTDNVDRIEIARGPVSVLYGSDAVTGVVQIFTRHGAGPTRADATFRAGSFGTWFGEGAVHGGGERMGFSAALSRYVTDGTYRFNSAYHSTAASGAITLMPDDRTSVTLTARTGDHRLNFPTDFAGNPVDSNAFTLQNTTTLGLDLGRRLSGASRLQLLLASYTATDGADDRPDGPADTTGSFASESQGRLLRQSADARLELDPGGAVRLVTGAVLEFEDLRETSQFTSNFGGGATTSADQFSATRRNGAAYGEALIRLGPRARVNLGTRVDQNQRFGTHATYRAGAVYRLVGTTRVRASIGSAFKEPSLRENFARSAFEVGNPGLRPERTRSWEVGLEQSAVGGRVVLAATWFDQRFRDLIQYNSNAAPGAATYANVARATSRGLELSATARPVEPVTLSASYTWLRTRVDDAGFSTAPGDQFVEGKPLIRRPAHSARLDIHGRIARRFGLGAAVSYVGRREDVDFRPFPSVRVSLPGYILADLDADADILRRRAGAPSLTATLRVENLFDRRYQTVVAFPGRGRAVLAGLRAGF